MKEHLDETNLEILRILQADGSITNADLSRKIGLKPPSVLQRVRKLEQLDLIKGYTAHLNAEELGFGLTIFAQVSLALHQDQPIENFVNSVSGIPEVLEVHHVSGEFDFLLRIVVQNMRHYEQLIRDRLSSIKGMGKLQSCFVLASPKESYALPI
ncbi:MAG: Lrp/AsnC family transcriptional regulator [Chthonomonas sp.]|nr:Lrp/AsnC family transcriptional regulator [Chthonomonas sp.]